MAPRELVGRRHCVLVVWPGLLVCLLLLALRTAFVDVTLLTTSHTKAPFETTLEFLI